MDFVHHYQANGHYLLIYLICVKISLWVTAFLLAAAQRAGNNMHTFSVCNLADLGEKVLQEDKHMHERWK